MINYIPMGVTLFLAVTLAMTVIGAIIRTIYWGRVERAFRIKLQEWGKSDGYEIVQARRIARYQYPAELTRDPRAAAGVFVFKFIAVDPDGKTRRGTIRFAHPDGRFAAPTLAVWEPTGPSFDDIE